MKILNIEGTGERNEERKRRARQLKPFHVQLTELQLKIFADLSRELYLST
jgi:hypothetical protein